MDNNGFVAVDLDLDHIVATVTSNGMVNIRGYKTHGNGISIKDLRKIVRFYDQYDKMIADMNEQIMEAIDEDT